MDDSEILACIGAESTTMHSFPHTPSCGNYGWLAIAMAGRNEDIKAARLVFFAGGRVRPTNRRICLFTKKRR